MEIIKDIEQERDSILDQMRSIRSMKRGTINEQYLKSKPKGDEEPILRGPYYVFSRREGGKTKSERLSSPEALKQAQDDVAAYSHFVDLCKEYEKLTERLGEIERNLDEELQKKLPKSRSKKTRN